MTALILIIDDELPVREVLRDRLNDRFPQARVMLFDDPIEVIAEEPTDATHAFVDLSFSRDSEYYGGRDSEVSIGADAIHYLASAAPSCRISVITSLDTDLHRSMANAVIEAWGPIPFISKQDFAFLNYCEFFVKGEPVPSSAELRLDLRESDKPLDIRAAVEAGMYKRSAGELLCVLATFPFPPSPEQLSSASGKTPNNVKKHLQSIGFSLRQQGHIPEDRNAEIPVVWLWARARRPLLIAQYRGLQRDS